MSVGHQTMVVYGWDIGAEQYKSFDPEPDSDEWENEFVRDGYDWHERDVGDVSVIYDGRGGDYCYVGVVIAATNSTSDGPQSFDESVELEGAIEYEQAMSLGELVGEYDLDTEGEASYHVFTHVR